MEHKYLRDGRAPEPSSEITSRVMSANKGKNTKPEIVLRKALWATGLKGYRLHRKDLPGRPDIAFVKNKLAIFINGCYWHRCPKCKLSLPKTHTAFWKDKFKRNVKRDVAKRKLLKTNGWKVLTLWECDVKGSLSTQVNRVADYLGSKINREEDVDFSEESIKEENNKKHSKQENTSKGFCSTRG